MYIYIYICLLQRLDEELPLLPDLGRLGAVVALRKEYIYIYIHRERER